MSHLIMNAALKGTIVLGAAWIATAILRRSSADLRHRIWLAAMIAMALLLIPVSAPQTMRMTIDANAAAPAAVSAARSIAVLPIVWAAIAALLLVRWAAGIFRLHRITRESRVEHEVLVSDAILTPMTWGAIHPVILVPGYMEDWSSGQRNVVICHERAHIQRRDWLWQSFAQALTAIFWFHPLMWLSASQLRNEAEHAADDATLAAGIPATDYADRLVAVARQIQAKTPIAAVAMVRNPALAGRISAILDASRKRTGASVRVRILILAAAAALLVPLSAFQNRPVYRAGVDGVTAPKVVYKTQPSYTPEAKAARIQGTVELTAVVNAAGRTEEITVTRSLDPGLNTNSVLALTQWIFEPGTKDGQPVDVAVTIDINFMLK